MDKQCYEFAGRATGTGQRRQCEQDATWHALFLEEWRPLCRYHVREYYDLPNHRTNDVLVCTHQ